MLVKLLTNLGGRQYPFAAADPNQWLEGMEVEIVDDDLAKSAVLRRHAVEIVVPPKVTAKVAVAPAAVKVEPPIVPETKVTAKPERKLQGKE